MNQGPTGFDLCLPGIVAGLILAVVLLAMGNTVFPDPFRQVFPHQTFAVLSVATGVASALGVMSLFLQSRGDEEKNRQHIPSNDSKKKNGFPSGGADAF
jgi:hypothetical protein